MLKICAGKDLEESLFNVVNFRTDSLKEDSSGMSFLCLHGWLFCAAAPLSCHLARATCMEYTADEWIDFS